MKNFRTEKDKHRYYQSLSGEQKYEALNAMISESNHVVFLGGAGVSTGSGIPDFRSENGLYRKKKKGFRQYRPEYLLSHQCLKRQPEVFFDYYRKNMDARSAEPNAAHLKLARMEAAGMLDGVITQNIDGLHQKAGSQNVQEIHGTIRTNHCVSCHREYDQDFIFDNENLIPRCPECGKLVRPDVILYGELLPEKAYARSIDLVCDADCLIIGGTSLAVGSAAQLAHLFHGKYLIIINKGKTRMEGAADLVFHEDIGSVIEKIE